MKTITQTSLVGAVLQVFQFHTEVLTWRNLLADAISAKILEELLSRCSIPEATVH